MHQPPARCLCLLSVAVGCAFSQAERPDVKGSQDHPQISRYPGSRIMEYRQVDFDQYSLPTAVENRRPSKTKTLEGKVTRIYYQNPHGRSTLEIYRNYEQALKANGFQEVFACQGPACGIGAVWNTFNGSRVSGTGDVIRYLAAQRGGESVSLMVSPNATSLHVIESKEMEAGLVTVSAEKMAEGIDREGHISLYAIYFDTGKSMLKPESEPALQQIAKLMASRPDLKLHVVGHTDTTGGLASNMKLSADRAAAVVTALTAKHGLQPTRLEAHGVGPLAPVATNATEEGKAKNRRVDLVAQ